MGTLVARALLGAHRMSAELFVGPHMRAFTKEVNVLFGEQHSSYGPVKQKTLASPMPIACILVALMMGWSMTSTAQTSQLAAPIVIGHRGASGYVPEHTLTSYFIAIQDGGDYVEPDLVMTKDAVLVARHENEIGGTTNVAEHPEFASRRATKVIDGTSITGWFTEDFTLAELKTLRARERIPETRPGNTRFDGQFEIPTFEEILALVHGVEEQREARARQLGLPPPQRIGVYPETKHPTYFANAGLPMEELLVRTLERHGYKGRKGLAYIQSFETSNLKALSKMTQLPLVQLIDAE